VRRLGFGLATAIFLVLFGWLAARSQVAFAPTSSILNSKHDFRAASSSAIRASSENDPCVFCHTPHNATPGPELWNHKMSTTTFPTYSSSTLQSTVGEIQDADTSKLCLSCHDGTIALASTVNNGEIEFVGGPDYKLPNTSASNLAGYGGKGFADDHPFAFAPSTTNPEIQMPGPTDAVRLDGGKVQCTSCHNPHKENIDATTGKFLVKANQSSSLCLTCHNKTGWTGSAHQAPPDPLQDQKYTSTQGAHTGYVGVANNGCESCHRPHTAGRSERLTKFVEEGTCYKCHDGSVATLNVSTDLTTKTYRHPVDITPSVHDASEGAVGSAYPMPENSATTQRHSECEDCHNPHQAKPTPPGNQPFPPALTPPLNGASGYSTTRAWLKQAGNEYEVCFKCHADSANRPQLSDSSLAGIGFGRNPQRQYDLGSLDAFNTRVEFAQGLSYHPVTRANPLAPITSLRPAMVQSDGTTEIVSRPLGANAQIYCSDCHASDTNRTLGGTNSGATGAHGSNIQHLLERQNILETPPAKAGDPGNNVPYAVGNYALCNKCHKVDEIINRNLDSFPEHQTHIEQTPCSTCHDPHASQAPHLINFDLSIVGKSAVGPIQYLQTSPGHGSCTLYCHGHDHGPLTY
jgi:predicted CXXCH cytochrome family protein